MYSVFLSLGYTQSLCLSPILSHFVAALGSAQTAESLTMMPIIHQLHCWIHDTHPEQCNTAPTQMCTETHTDTPQTHVYKCKCNKVTLRAEENILENL